MDWIIGGTKDSREFLDLLKNNDINLNQLIVSVATEYGKKLVNEINTDISAEDRLNIIQKPMDQKEMEDFIEKNKIERVFDFSHPYAVDVSKNAIEATKNKNIKYYRFERENLNYDNANSFENIDDLIAYLENVEGNILVTLGSNNIKSFENMKNLKNIYFRILPVTISLKKLEDIGIKARNIIGLQGPFSKEFNQAIYENYNIKYMVTKESGETGGEREKLDSAKLLGITPVILRRPKIEYPWVSSSLSKLFKIFIKVL